jgi:hypothetical protein
MRSEFFCKKFKCEVTGSYESSHITRTQKFVMIKNIRMIHNHYLKMHCVLNIRHIIKLRFVIYMLLIIYNIF